MIEAGNGDQQESSASGGGVSRIFKNIQLTPDGAPLLQDMELDEKNGILYAMSAYAVYKVNLRLCSQAVRVIVL